MSLKRLLKEKDPNLPKRPATAFFLFSSANRRKITAELGTKAGRGAVAMALSERWKNLAQNDKEAYNTMYEKNKEKYKKTLAKYQASDTARAFRKAMKKKAKVRKMTEIWARSSPGDQRLDAVPAPAPAPAPVAAGSSSAGSYLSGVSTEAILMELSERHGWKLVAAAPAAAPEVPAAPSEGQHGILGTALLPAKAPMASTMAPMASTSSAPMAMTAPASSSGQAPELIEGWEVWLTPRRRQIIIDDIGTEDEDEVEDEAVLRFAELEDEKRAKFARKSRERAAEAAAAAQEDAN